MKIALVSLNQTWEDKKSNEKQCTKYAKLASQFGSDLIIFPEMTLTGFSMNTSLISEDPENSQTIGFFSELAIQNKISIAFGIVLRQGEKATNNLIIIDHKGNVASTYSKIHPFAYSGEDKYYTGGDKIASCKILDANIGLTICYDLRFPELFQALSKECNIIITIANWPASRIEHWKTLLKARSIENQLFIAGVNRTGIDGRHIKYISSSDLFDPSGKKIRPVQSLRGLKIYEASLTEVEAVRKSFPFKQDRKIEFYKSIL